MNNRIWFAILGIALTVVSAALLGFGKSSMTVQVCLALGMAIGFLAIGLEHFYDSPFLIISQTRTKALGMCSLSRNRPTAFNGANLFV
jgi:hypothetical protein